jgi:hypothetical protein
MSRAASSTVLRAWRRVVFAADCDEDGNCPLCGVDYGECSCPGPTMDDHDYRVIDGALHARKRK